MTGEKRGRRRRRVKQKEEKCPDSPEPHRCWRLAVESKPEKKSGVRRWFLQTDCATKIGFIFADFLSRIFFNKGMTMHSYITPYLLYKEETHRVSKDDMVEQQVETIMAKLVKKLRQRKDIFGHGKMVACGSMAEGIKVGWADEFDYHYVVDVEGYTFQKTQLQRTKPPSKDNPGHKAFYKISKNGVEVHAKEIQESFRSIVQGVVDGVCIENKNGCRLCIHTKLTGPAVKITWGRKEILVSSRQRSSCLINIDITFAIRVDPTLVLRKDDLTPLATELYDKGELKCEFVAAWDYWKLTFTETETELMKSLCERDMYKGVIIRAIKAMRDEEDVKDVYGDGILSSYPIKVTFMDKALKDKKQWPLCEVGPKVIQILEMVRERGEKHEIRGLFLKDDDIMGEADRSFLESHRILQAIKQGENIFKWNSITTLLRVIVILCLMTDVFAINRMSRPVMETDQNTSTHKTPPNNIAFHATKQGVFWGGDPAFRVYSAESDPVHRVSESE